MNIDFFLDNNTEEQFKTTEKKKSFNNNNGNDNFNNHFDYINSVMISGFVKAKPLIKTNNSGKKMMVFLFQISGFNNHKQTFHVTVFKEALIERINPILTINSNILILGSLNARTYKDQNDNWITKTNIIGNSIKIYQEKN